MDIKRLLAAAITALPIAANAIVVDPDVWFAYSEYAGSLSLLSRKACDVPGAPNKQWMLAKAFFPRNFPVSFCWIESKKPGAIKLCRIDSKGDGFVMGSTCIEMQMSWFKDTRSLPQEPPPAKF